MRSCVVLGGGGRHRFSWLLLLCCDMTLTGGVSSVVSRDGKCTIFDGVQYGAVRAEEEARQKSRELS